MLERDIQQHGVSYARRQGCVAHKFSSEARRNVPDYLFLYNGRLLFIEYKATGKEARAGQIKEHKKLMAAGFNVYVVDEKRYGKQVIDAFMRDALI